MSLLAAGEFCAADGKYSHLRDKTAYQNYRYSRAIRFRPAFLKPLIRGRSLHNSNVGWKLGATTCDESGALRGV